MNRFFNIKKSKDTPLNIAIDDYKTLIFENSPYSNSNSVLEKSLSKITTNDIKDYYDKTFYPANITISINGNVDKEKTLDEFTKIFNNKKGEKDNKCGPVCNKNGSSGSNNTFSTFELIKNGEYVTDHTEKSCGVRAKTSE